MPKKRKKLSGSSGDGDLSSSAEEPSLKRSQIYAMEAGADKVGAHPPVSIINMESEVAKKKPGKKKELEKQGAIQNVKPKPQPFTGKDSNIPLPYGERIGGFNEKVVEAVSKQIVKLKQQYAKRQKRKKRLKEKAKRKKALKERRYGKFTWGQFGAKNKDAYITAVKFCIFFYYVWCLIAFFYFISIVR